MLCGCKAVSSNVDLATNVSMKDTDSLEYKLLWEAMSGAMIVELALEEMQLD